MSSKALLLKRGDQIVKNGTRFAFDEGRQEPLYPEGESWKVLLVNSINDDGNTYTLRTKDGGRAVLHQRFITSEFFDLA